jgi:HD-GYP domain-containing protein (c-di-GMP phosphodiesterase class II)
MTTDRPYRRALSTTLAREVLREESGRQFDPRVVATFLAVLDDQPWP